MAYTITSGLHRETWHRFVRDSGVALPIIAILFIIIAAISVSTNQSSGQSPYIPAKKINSATTASVSKPDSTKPSTTPSSSSNNDKTASTNPTPAMSFGALDSGTAPAISPPQTGGVTGGLGGGDIVPTDSGGGTPTGGTTAPAPTVVCENTLTTAQICTVCSNSLLVQPGDKALLYSDGTCIAAN